MMVGTDVNTGIASATATGGGVVEEGVLLLLLLLLLLLRLGVVRERTW